MDSLLLNSQCLLSHMDQGIKVQRSTFQYVLKFQPILEASKVYILHMD